MRIRIRIRVGMILDQNSFRKDVRIRILELELELGLGLGFILEFRINEKKINNQNKDEILELSCAYAHALHVAKSFRMTIKMRIKILGLGLEFRMTIE